MKISKVNHTKAGVGIDEARSRGILYADPKRREENHLDLEEHVRGLNKNAQRLYSLFRTVSETGIRGKKYKDIIKFSGELKKQVLERSASDQMRSLNTWIEERLKSGTAFNTYKSLRDLKSEDIDAVVDSYLRNSLRKSVRLKASAKEAYIPDLIKRLLKMPIQTKGVQTEPLSEEEKRILLQALNEDYGKKEALKKIVHSIEVQNVRVSCTEKNGKALLQLSNAEHKKKKQVFLFLQKFAAAENETEREEMLRHFKRLVLLFYCGRGKYEESMSGPVPVWSWGLLQEDLAVNFDDDAYKKISERASSRNKSERKRIEDSIQRRLRERIISRYREAVSFLREAADAEQTMEADSYWLQYIENSAEKLLLGKRNINPVKLSVAYLCEHTYREWVSYLCLKMIDMGKGVYHFAAPRDLKKVISGEAEIGEVLPEYKDGITSFDYERIKAEEALNRDLSLYITFAVNNFARSVMSADARKKGQEDILSLSETDLKDSMYPDTDRKILRFFGGKSTWNNGELEGVQTMELVQAIKEALQSLRNCNFHYTAGISSEPGSCRFVLEKLFQKEWKETAGVYRKKYDSNNVWMFYSKADIESLMDHLYCREPERPAQIPAFGKIIHMANMEEIVDKLVGKKKKKLTSGDNSLERMEKFRAALFFVLKEIYYYGFLQDENVKTCFLEIVDGEKQPQDRREQEAHKNFKDYLSLLRKSNPNMTFGELCQQIMTDYNQQNQGNQRVASNQEGHSAEKYKHFRMLLYVYIKEAFLRYLKDEAHECYHFLRSPENREAARDNHLAEAFCAEWQPHLYDSLRDRIGQKGELLSWYTTAHFLNQKQLNMLIGCIKNYIQYAKDIERRCADTQNRTGTDLLQNAAEYKDILSVLEFCKLFCGSVTNCFEDYFEDEDDYARHLANYVDFESRNQNDRLALKAFCSQPVKAGSPTKTIGLYYDAFHPIINKNMVYAGMYGNEKLFRNCFQKISAQQLNRYYKARNELAEVFKNGKCKDMEDEKKLRKFQCLKNHVELTEITTYSEIVNDFMGQLISWAYLRERDLMYFQLGFHYMRLNYSDRVEESSYLRQLEGDGIHIQDGAVLYQIIAMYTYDLPVFGRDKSGNAVCKKENASNGESVGMFYKKYCQDDGEIYEMGLNLFENVRKEHDEIVSFRNYIDHFKYYSSMDRSILDLYSDMYDRFFTYDVKLRKSVSFIFKNILARYFVIAETEMQTEDRIRYEKGKEESVLVKKDAAKLSIKSLESDLFQPSKGIEHDKKDVIYARGKEFIAQLQRILEYKEQKDE